LLLQAECSNGTLHQYFYNSAGDTAKETLAALKRLGAVSAYEVFAKAIAVFGESGYTSDRNARQQRLDSIPDQHRVFGQLTDELFEKSEDVVSLAIDRVGDAYNEQQIKPNAYERKSSLRIASLVLLVVLIMGAATLTVCGIMGLL
jgi:hypothetical protein